MIFTIVNLISEEEIQWEKFSNKLYHRVTYDFTFLRFLKEYTTKLQGAIELSIHQQTSQSYHTMQEILILSLYLGQYILFRKSADVTFLNSFIRQTWWKKNRKSREDVEILNMSSIINNEKMGKSPEYQFGFLCCPVWVLFDHRWSWFHRTPQSAGSSSAGPITFHTAKTLSPSSESGMVVTSLALVAVPLGFFLLLIFWFTLLRILPTNSSNPFLAISSWWFLPIASKTRT